MGTGKVKLFQEYYLLLKQDKIKINVDKSFLFFLCYESVKL